MPDKTSAKSTAIRRTKTSVAANPNGNRAERRAAAKTTKTQKGQQR